MNKNAPVHESKRYISVEKEYLLKNMQADGRILFMHVKTRPEW